MAEEEIFENERYIPIRGWSSNNLNPLTDRKRYSLGRSSGSRSVSEIPKLPLEEGDFHLRSLADTIPLA